MGLASVGSARRSSVLANLAKHSRDSKGHRAAACQAEASKQVTTQSPSWRCEMFSRVCAFRCHTRAAQRMAVQRRAPQAIVRCNGLLGGHDPRTRTSPPPAVLLSLESPSGPAAPPLLQRERLAHKAVQCLCAETFALMPRSPSGIEGEEELERGDDARLVSRR